MSLCNQDAAKQLYSTLRNNISALNNNILWIREQKLNWTFIFKHLRNSFMQNGLFKVYFSLFISSCERIQLVCLYTTLYQLSSNLKDKNLVYKANSWKQARCGTKLPADCFTSSFEIFFEPLILVACGLVSWVSMATECSITGLCRGCCKMSRVLYSARDFIRFQRIHR